MRLTSLRAVPGSRFLAGRDDQGREVGNCAPDFPRSTEKPRVAIYSRSQRRVDPTEGTSHEESRFRFPPRPNPVRHLGEQLLPGLAALRACRSEHRPVRRRGDESHLGDAKGTGESARLSGHRLDDPLALEVLERSVRLQLPGPPSPWLPCRAGLCDRSASDSPRCGRGRRIGERCRRGLGFRSHERLSRRRFS